MDLQAVTMDRQKAREAFLEYRDAVRIRHDEEDAQIMRGYRALAQGKQVINLRETIAAGGVDERGLPRLAIMQADQRWCYVERTNDGDVTFASVQRWERAPNRRRGIYRLPVATLPTRDELGLTGHPWQWWSGSLRAMVPIVPPALRPAHHLRNYEILWEVERWEKAPRPPGDPALLKHIGGELYAVVAVWDLTDLERAVLAGRRVEA